MITADLERPMPAAAPLDRAGGQTLQDVLCGVWEDLRSHRTAACPICGGAMAPRYGSGPTAAGGRCRDCATELA
ncbi:MAG: hypothetical protein M3296_08365 [Actinomycetota bacterium]|nr:hypothetical protein [Actinomycetota bacterium]